MMISPRDEKEQDGAAVALPPPSPLGLGTKITLVLATLATIGGQTLQNISLPLALSSDTDMSVFLVYTAFVYFCFFAVLDVVLDAAVPSTRSVTLRMSHRRLMFVGMENAMNGAGVVFGGSSTRTPLTMQMGIFLTTNLVAPFYKILRFRGISGYGDLIRRVGVRGWCWYAAAASGYLIAMMLVMVDKVRHGGSSGNALNAYCLFFVGGTLLGMMYNVDQDVVMARTHTFSNHSEVPVASEQLTRLQHLKRDVMVLRTQTTWLFLWSWLAVLLSVAGASQGGPLTSATFLASWAEFLPFGNLWMNLFNVGFVASFLGNIILNRQDSSFTMIINNVSAVSAMWVGWVPSIMMQTVGFSPSVPMTVSAMVLSLGAIFPSWKFSETFKVVMKFAEEKSQADEDGARDLLLQKDFS